MDYGGTDRRPDDARPLTELRLTFIVARGHDRLREDLVASFTDTDGAAVIVDRRRDERRRSSASAIISERRRTDRRIQHDAQDRLRDLGWTLIRAT